MGVAAVCWVGHYLGGCGSLVGVEVMEWVWQWSDGCGSSLISVAAVGRVC